MIYPYAHFLLRLLHKRLNYIVLLSFCILFFSSNAVAQQLTIAQRASKLVETIERFHYEPRTVDNEFSELVFNGLIQQLDPNSLYFTTEDLQELEQYKESIDDEIKNNQPQFVVAVTELFEKKITRRDSIIQSLTQTDIKLSKKDSILFIPKNTNLSDSELTDFWVKYVKLKILRSYFSKIDSVAGAKQPTQSEINILRDKIIKQEKCSMQSKLSPVGGLPEFVGNAYINCIAKAFDPHTLYFNKQQERDFMKLVSKESKSFGFEISKNDMGEFEITSLVPGGPAWNSAKINEGDVILGFENEEGNATLFDCLSSIDVVHYIADGNLNKASFHIRKKNGTKEFVSLQKQLIDIEDNVIESFIIEGKQKLGYIYLPSFYTQMNDNYGREKGCANDVAKELIKLKQEGIKGLVIDLRNNGGGSMLEAVRMAGIFIDYGSMGIIDNRDEEPMSMKDMNRGTIFNQPLIILVNRFTASSSELFSAALQDYNRAVIVGTATYGKSTAQNIIPLEAVDLSPKKTNYKPENGTIKITGSAFYRINGTSHQLKGVIPDVHLPFVYDSLAYGEMSYPSALKPSTTDKKTYFKALDSLPTYQLQEKSRARIEKDSNFIQIINYSSEIAASNRYYSLPISFVEYQTYITPIEDSEEEMKQTLYKVKNPSYLEGISTINDNNIEINSKKMKQLEQDIYILEVYQIMKDLMDI